MYVGDPFFSPTMAGRTGLIVLSLVLAASVVAVFIRSVSPLPTLVRLLLALLVFWAFVWLSPQVYYLYYLMLFDGLPLQIVVQTPPGPSELAGLLSFTGIASLARHSQGVLGWALILLSFLSGPVNLRERFRSFLRH